MSIHIGRERVREGERGQSLVEFALMLPILLLLLLGAIDLGRAFHSSISITNAAREGAFYGASKPTDSSGIATRVRQELGLAASDASVSVSTACSAPACARSTGTDWASTETITVEAQTDFNFLTPFMNDFFGGSLDLEADATAVIP